MKKKIKSFLFICDGWYYDDQGYMQDCHNDADSQMYEDNKCIAPITLEERNSRAYIRLSGTKEDIDNELARAGWKTEYNYEAKDTHLCSREHYADTWTEEKNLIRKSRERKPLTHREQMSLLAQRIEEPVPEPDPRRNVSDLLKGQEPL